MAERKKGENLFNPFLNALFSRGDIQKMLQAFLQQSAKLRGPGEIFYSVNVKFFFLLRSHTNLIFVLHFSFGVHFYIQWDDIVLENFEKESWRLAYPIELLMFLLLRFLSSAIEGG